jgi:hypothetical protein
MNYFIYRYHHMKNHWTSFDWIMGGSLTVIVSGAIAFFVWAFCQ